MRVPKYTRNFFIGENEDKVSVINRLNSQIDNPHLVDAIFRKAHNNKVGYYLFQEDGIYCRLFFLPKHIKIPNEENLEEVKKAVKKFLEYLTIDFQLKSDHNERYNNTMSIGKTPIEFGFWGKNSPYRTQDDVEQFTFLRLLSFLKNIEQFFKAHKAVKRRSVSYTSQTIRHRLDLGKNIKELNKTEIHQLKHIDIIYSEVANITYGAMKLFIQSKLPIIQNSQAKEELLKVSKNIQRLLEKKFKAERGKRLTPYMLVSRKVYKYFRTRNTFMQLYVNILSLFGLENFFEENTNFDLNRDVKSEAFFLDPSLLYEWYVYDSILGLDEFSKDNSRRYRVLMDKDSGTTKSYIVVNTKLGKGESISSNPDIIIFDTEEQRLFVIDVKWKLASDSIPKLEDILKLKRDCEIRNREHKVYAVLVYPQVEDNLFIEKLYDNVSTFSFYTRKLPVGEEPLNFDLSKLFTPAFLSVENN